MSKKNKWYQRWLTLARTIKKSGASDSKAILLTAYKIMEDAEGHRFNWIAQTSYRDLLEVIENCLDRDCETCPERFNCWTRR